ncbi:MAG: serine/threonine-protein kinase [Planctomycetota bacterium]
MTAEGSSDSSSGFSSSDRLKAMLSQALELQGEAREAFIDGASERDSALAGRLRELARAWDHATTLLRDDDSGATIPPIGLKPAGKPEDLIGNRVERYRFDAVLGSGGFGVVYRAHQDSPVRRDVALKVVRPGGSSVEFLARFEGERQALARLSHPSIARIYDAGALPDGRPFFAMELVEGEPITTYCDRARLTIRERIVLLAEAARAVQHAHQKGVIHRDLKPSNVLVGDGDEGPFVKIIDFGIAKAIGEPLADDMAVTRAQQIIGTPQYMSPEQAMGDRDAIDTRSDVFSLGVILYELLCGARPIADEVFGATPPGELGRLLMTTPMVRPSIRLGQLGSMGAPMGGSMSGSMRGEVAGARGSTPERLPLELAGELDWIAARAIDAEPDRRYASPAAMADDLGNYLADEPVEARPPSRSYLVKKFARRHKAAVASVVGLAAMLAAVLVVLTASLAIVNSERAAALDAKSEALAINDFLTSVLSSARGDRMGRGVTVLEAVEAGADEIDDRFADQPVAAATAHHSVGTLLMTLGEPQRANGHLLRAVELMDEAGEHDSATAIMIRSDAALSYVDLGQPEELRKRLTDVYRDVQHAMAPDEPQRLLVAANFAANVLMLDGAIDEGRAIIEETIRRAARQPESESAMEAHLLGLFSLAHAERERGDDEAASGYLRQMLEMTEAEPGRWSRHRLGAMNNLATGMIRAGRYEESLELLGEIRTIMEGRFGPNNTSLLHVLNNIASVLKRLGRYDEAIELRDEAERRAAEVLPAGHPTHGRLLESRAELLVVMGRIDEAERAFLAAHEIYEGVPGLPPQLISGNAGALASLYREMGRERDSEHWARVAGDED